VASTLDVGDRLPDLVSTPLTRTEIVRYQGASGDLNPIHHDDDFAHTAGYPSAFAPGMLAAGVLGTHLAETFGPEHIRRLKVRFRAQAWPGDILTYAVSVSGRSGETLTVDCEVTRQTGEVHLTGEAVIALS
jgi:acyl dehydratase